MTTNTTQAETTDPIDSFLIELDIVDQFDIDHSDPTYLQLKAAINTEIARQVAEAELKAVLSYNKLDNVGKILWLRERAINEIDSLRELVAEVEAQLKGTE